MSRIYRATMLCLALAILLAPAVNVAASEGSQRFQVRPIDLGKTNDALQMDATQYAMMFGVDMASAIRQLNLQQDIGELSARLTKSEAATFAGMWIQHQPSYKIIVQFTSLTMLD